MIGDRNNEHSHLLQFNLQHQLIKQINYNKREIKLFAILFPTKKKLTNFIKQSTETNTTFYKNEYYHSITKVFGTTCSNTSKIKRT